MSAPIATNVAMQNERTSSYQIPREAITKEVQSYTKPYKPPKQWARAEQVVANDTFIKSGNVFGLKWNTFSDFLSQKDVALVMFYNTANTTSFHVRPHFVHAAENTRRANHAFAAVNCRRESALCEREKVTEFPTLKVYSKGRSVGKVMDFINFDAEIMRKYVENSPIYEEVNTKRPVGRSYQISN